MNYDFQSPIPMSVVRSPSKTTIPNPSQTKNDTPGQKTSNKVAGQDFPLLKYNAISSNVVLVDIKYNNKYN